jgi:urease subunit alpha
MSQASIAAGVPGELGLARRIEPVQRCRSVGKQHMVRNDALPRIEVDPETYKVTVDGEPATIEPAERLPLNQLFYIV